MARKHPNVLKAQRQRRQGRRAYLTDKFSLIHVPRGMGIAHIPEDAQPLFKRKYVTWEDSAFLNTIFPGRKVPASEWKAEGVEKFTNRDGTAIPTNVGEHNGRRYSLDMSDAMAILEYLEHEDVCDFHTVKELKMQQKRFTICFNRKKTAAFLVEVDYLQKYCRRSRTYGSYDRAMFLLQQQEKSISWHDPLPLESLLLILPR